MDVAAVVPAHNEEETIGFVLRAIASQTHKPKEIVVVLDRCTDNTEKIVNEMRVLEERRTRITPVRKHSVRYSLSDFGRIYAETINWGIRAISSDYDALLIVDADTVIKPRYLERGVKALSESSKFVIAGSLIGKKNIRGSGSIIKRSFLEEVSQGLYPEVGAPDTYLLYKAMFLGYDVYKIPDSEIEILRQSFEWPSMTKRIRRYYMLGKACWWLGYYPLYLLGRAVKTSIKDLPSGIALLMGFLYSYKNDKSLRADIAEFVSKNQREYISKLLTKFSS